MQNITSDILQVAQGKKNRLTIKTTMRQTILLLSFVLTTSICSGQIDHLVPAKDFKAYGSPLSEYYHGVFGLLYNGYSEKPIARYTSMPSFSKEYAFSIELIKDKKFVVSNRLTENYWYATDKYKVKMISGRAELTNDLYLKIAELFKLLAEQTRKPETDFSGLDGTTYYFATTEKDGVIRTGETWSPKGTSVLGRLVSICNSIYALGNGEKTTQADILKEIDKLLEDLR